jgi:hypothetical protein
MQSTRYSCQILMIHEFSRQTFRKKKKKTQIYNFIKIRPVGAKSFHAYGRTNVTKLIVSFRGFASAPKNGQKAKVITSSNKRQM